MSAGETRHGYPSLAASKFVRRYIERAQICLGSVIVTKPAVARSCALLDFELGDPLQIRSCTTAVTRQAELVALVGLETFAKHHFLIHGSYKGFQIHFRPSALKHLFGLPVPELTDQDYSGEAVLSSKVLELRQRLGEARSFEQRIQLADAFIVGCSLNKSYQRSIDLAATEIVRLQGSCSIDRLTHDTGFSARSFLRKFRECVGVSPKLYARLVRFESVLTAKAGNPQLSWTNVAHGAGYHDQMHMIHDFREFTGGSPTAMFGHAEQLLTPHADFKEGNAP